MIWINIYVISVEIKEHKSVRDHTWCRYCALRMIPRLELLLSAYMIVAGVSRTEGLAAALQATKKDQLVLERGF